MKRTGKAAPGSDNSALPLDESMGYLVRRTFRGMTDVLEDKLAEHNLSSSMWYFLRLLWERDGVPQRDLSQELGLTPATTVAAMDNLERRGLIRRSRDAEDRRVVNIYLTPAGELLGREILPYAEEVNDIILRELDSAQVETLRALLQAVNRSVNRYLSERR